jgi:hypothetical protein
MLDGDNGGDDDRAALVVKSVINLGANEITLLVAQSLVIQGAGAVISALITSNQNRWCKSKGVSAGFFAQTTCCTNDPFSTQFSSTEESGSQRC